MKKYIGLILALLLTGCGVDVFPSYVAKAEKVCAANDGWREINVGDFGYDVVCKNDAIFENLPLLQRESK